MHREFLGVSESDSLPEAAALLVDEETNCLVVVRGGEPVGRLESRDALDALLDATGVAGASEAETGPADLTVGDAMGPPLPAVSPDDSLAAVEERLVAEGADRVVALDDGSAVGVVTDGDALAAGAPRTGTGADGIGGEAAPGEPRADGAALSAAAADSDAERGAAATMDPEATAERGAAGSGDGPAGTDGGSDPVAEAAGGTSAQGVCENCGALVPDLVTANGQAVCPNCREI